MIRNRRFIILLAILTMILSSCAPKNDTNIRLCDYKHIPIPDESKKVSDEDIAVAISMDLFMYDVVIPKESNQYLVEWDDVVNISVSVNGDAPYEQTLIIGAEELGEAFDEHLIGKELAHEYSFSIDGTKYVVKINDISVYAETVTDDIAKQYFDCDSAQEVLAKTREEIVQGRAFEYMYPYLINHSMIRDYYEERDAYVEKVVGNVIKDALESGYDIAGNDKMDAFFQSQYEMTVSEFRHDLEAFYDEYLILTEFMRQEDSVITNEELYSQWSDNAEVDDENDEDDLFGIFGREYAIYSIYYEACRDLLLRYADI